MDILLAAAAAAPAVPAVDQGPSQLQTVLTSLVVAAVISGLVSLAAPWTQWSVERRKLRVHHQREAISEWRAGIEAWEAEHGGTVSIYPASFIKERWYFSLRRHLTDAERTEFEREDAGVNINVGPGGHQDVWNRFTREMLNAIDRIEKEWELP